MRALAGVVLLGACFDPSPEPGQPCTDWCPPPEQCIVNQCRLADSSLPNFAFVTSDVRMMANQTVRDLDEWCVQAAARARLPDGEYFAWVSAPGADAKDRFLMKGASGWLRPDNVPFAAKLDDIIAGTFYAPLRIAEDGRTDVGVRDQAIATGTSFDGTAVVGATCDGFSGTAPVGSRIAVGRADAGMQTWTMIGTGTSTCEMDAHIYCFGVDRPAVIEPPMIEPGGKRAFITKNKYTLRAVSGADQICNNEAGELPGSMKFAAILAPTNESVASRFGPGPWFRTDGVKLTDDKTTFLAPLEVAFDGKTHVKGEVWFGADSLTLKGDDSRNCTNFTAPGGSMRNGSSERSIGAAPFSTGNGNCGAEYHYYCAER